MVSAGKHILLAVVRLSIAQCDMALVLQCHKIVIVLMHTSRKWYSGYSATD